MSCNEDDLELYKMHAQNILILDFYGKNKTLKETLVSVRKLNRGKNIERDIGLYISLIFSWFKFEIALSLY